MMIDVGANKDYDINIKDDEGNDDTDKMMMIMTIMIIW